MPWKPPMPWWPFTNVPEWASGAPPTSSDAVTKHELDRPQQHGNLNDNGELSVHLAKHAKLGEDEGEVR